MQMGPKEIAVEYRPAANKMKQIVILAELNQCAERRIAEILDAEGEELPKKWQVQLMKPARRSRKFPEESAADFGPKVKSAENPEPETDAEEPEEPAETPSVTASRDTGRDTSLKEGGERATDRDLFDAVASLLPEPAGADALGGPQRCEDAEPETPRPEVDASGDVILGEVAEASLITREDLLLGACKNLLAALDLKPDEFHCYACGTLDLVFSLLGVPNVWQPIHDRRG